MEPVGTTGDLDAQAQRRLWDAIGPSFDATRGKPWPHVEAFLATLPPHSRVLDLMAGNGRHTETALRLGHQATWSDWSRTLAATAAKRCQGAHMVLADAAHLPFPDASFDAVLLVAGLASVPQGQRRAQVLSEARRVLAPGALVQVTTWSRAAPRFEAMGLATGPADVVVPWRAGGLDVERPYHLYSAQSLREALEAAGFVDVAVQTIRMGKEENLVAAARVAPPVEPKA